MKKITVPREKAVFWLDKNGCWHNEHGPFEHKKVIRYFHAAIRKDAGGYHVYQQSDEFEEKVYFNFEDTALFVFDLILDGDITAVLNTQKKILLNPKELFIRKDNLYVQLGDEIAKFTSQSLVTLSKRLFHEGEGVFIETNAGRVAIKRK
ncbi:MAG: MFS transporter permease [Desulfobacterales bacterium]|nr:MFS transporter permease [Desulfobacterales bacterium]